MQNDMADISNNTIKDSSSSDSLVQLIITPRPILHSTTLSKTPVQKLYFLLYQYGILFILDVYPCWWTFFGIGSVQLYTIFFLLKRIKQAQSVMIRIQKCLKINIIHKYQILLYLIRNWDAFSILIDTYRENIKY